MTLKQGIRLSPDAREKSQSLQQKLPTVLGSAALALGLLAQTSYGQKVITYNEVETFDAPVITAPDQQPDSWYPDRYSPNKFESFSLNGENVLRLHIHGIDDGPDNRGASAGSYYNTQGRKLDLPTGTLKVSARLFFPADWQGVDTRRRSDLWVTSIDENSNLYYPVIGIANLNGSPVIRYWDFHTKGWASASIAPVANTWHRFEILLIGTEIVYQVDGVEMGRFDSNGSTHFRDAMIQAYNFNDPNLPAAEQSDESYDAYWDDFSINFDLHDATQLSDLTVGGNRSLNSHKGAGVFSSNPNRQRLVSTAKSKTQLFVGLTNVGNYIGEFGLKANQRNSRRVRTTISETGSAGGNVTAKVQQGRYTKTLDAGQSAVYRVTNRLKTQRGGRGGRMLINTPRRVSDNTVFRAKANSGNDSVSTLVRFRP